jgi:ribosome maturation factor RimP
MDEAVLKKIEELAATVLNNLGFQLIDLELVVEHGRFTLRLYIDKEGGGVTIDDCELTSHAVEDVIEAERIVGASYNLEVSSPGLDRPLKSQSDFEKNIGEVIRLKTREPIDGRSNYKGLLEAVKDGRVNMIIDGMRFEIPLAQIFRARLIPKIGELKKRH